MIGQLMRQTMAFALALICLLVAFGHAQAVEPVGVSKDQNAIDITNIGEWYRDIDGNLRISTAPDRDGIVRRVEIRSRSGQPTSNWYVFALANDSTEQIDRLIVAPHYRLVDSGLFWPDLDSQRIAAITPSEGFALEEQDDREADVFLITLNPGAVITLIAETRTPNLPKLVLWEPSAYKDTVNSLTLYRGIVLGISGLLAVFLTILFVVKGTAIFPATAALAWGVLAYVCVDFGFWDRVITISQASEPVWRAGTEVFLAFGLLIFLYSYLRLNRWSRYFTFGVIAWLLAVGVLLGFLFIDPAIASGLARLSFGLTAAIAALLILYLSFFRRDDRSIMLIPIWAMTVAWVFAFWLTVTGQSSNDIIQPALGGGLVLIVLLISFTILQNAFSGMALAQGLVSDAERHALALAGSGDILWDWDPQRNTVYTGYGLTEALGIAQRDINGSLQKIASLLHSNDRDRFHATLESVKEHRRGRIAQSFRIATSDGHYRWFRLKARPMLGMQGELVRCVGTLTDVTDAKNAEIRLLQDAVKDNLTGLENRELFVNRLDMLMQLHRQKPEIRPSVFHINLDGFREINNSVGFATGDTILLTVARRLTRLLRPGDSIARLGGDQFAILLNSETEADRIAAFADSIRKTLKAAVDFAGQEIQISASIGIATCTQEQTSAEALMHDAELGMLHAKRHGGNRIEPFRPSFRSGKDETIVLMDDLRVALDRGTISVVYQPIVRIEDQTTAGFEALLRWNHPRLGLVPPSDFIPIAESSGLIRQLGKYVASQAVNDFKSVFEVSKDFRPFVSVNMSSRELLGENFVNDISQLLSDTEFPAENFKLELTETMVMENPEHSGQVLKRLASLGVGLSLDDFGTGYSSLSYLMRFPFDTLKIDSSFIQARNSKERLIVLRAIIAMAHGLEQSLVAEGVELKNDLAELKELGCEFAQGFLFGEPITATEVEGLMAEEIRLAGQ